MSINDSLTGYSTADGNYLMQFTEDAWNKLDVLCNRARNVETGGIIIGYYSENNVKATITDVTSAPKDSKSGRSSFQRGVMGLSKLLRSLWIQDRRTYYIGEWHYHPSLHLHPSSIDIAQMQAIASSCQYQCREPIMIIVGKKRVNIRKIRVFVAPYGKMILEMTNCEK